MDKQTSSLPLRSETDARYKWKLEDMYSSIEEWEKDFDKLKVLITKINKFKGQLEKDPNQLLECLRLSDTILLLCESLLSYAMMRKDEDNTNNIYVALSDRATSILTDVTAAISFIKPEIISIPDHQLESYILQEKELDLYKHYIDAVIRTKRHTLSEHEEELVALTGEMAQAPLDIFTMFNNADLKFPTIQNDTGDMIELTKGNYIKFLESNDQKVRKDAFKATYFVYNQFRNTLASIFINNVKKNKFFAKARHYPSCLEASLDEDNITREVYINLIDTIHLNLPSLHRYLDLRKKSLGLENLHVYDLFVSSTNQPKRTFKFEEAIDLVQKGLHPLSSEYLGILKQGLNSGWIDVYENQGKTSGAYCLGTYSAHPYILLNYQGTIHDVFALAHEMGHALHSFYTNKTQPYVNSSYKIFLAEVASTVNELLLIDYMIKNTSDIKEQTFLLNHSLDEFRGTVFRQVMLAEFEMIVHEKVENGVALTADRLCEIYYNLIKLYYGDSIVMDDEIAMDWARIPHFYDSFYVYKYATGFSAAISISSRILSEGQPVVDSYIDFLKSGDSNYPLELLKIAGVDLSTPKPVQDALDVFEKTLSKLERMIQPKT